MKKSVISATGLLAIAMVLTIASLAVGTTIQVQAKYIDNHHSHSDNDNLKGNEGGVTNCSGDNCLDSNGLPVEKYHSNFNDNTNREGETSEDRTNRNTHEIPNKGGNSD
jgi:hypothetical protein